MKGSTENVVTGKQRNIMVSLHIVIIVNIIGSKNALIVSNQRKNMVVKRTFYYSKSTIDHDPICTH